MLAEASTSKGQPLDGLDTWTDQPLQLYNIRQDRYEKRNLAGERFEIVAQLSERLASHRKSARQEEPPERIPNHPPAVYGEDENAKYGDWVRQQAEKMRLKQQDAKTQRRERRKSR